MTIWELVLVAWLICPVVALFSVGAATLLIEWYFKAKLEYQQRLFTAVCDEKQRGE